MIFNVNFDCKCSGSVDENIHVSDPISGLDDESSCVDHHQQLSCDSCSLVYDVRISDKYGNPKIHAPGAFNLRFELVDSETLSYNRETTINWSEDDDELAWVMQSTVQLENFQKIMTDVVQLLRAGIVIPNMSTLYNMAYAQVVTAVEAYLSGIFIHTVVNSPPLMRKLIETDPELSKRPLVLKDIFEQWDGLQLLVATYLQDLIFHNLEKIKPMYKSVLGIEFGEVGWLFKAVKLRHDCVHRNGVDKSGKPTGIDYPVIETLIKQCVALLSRIDQEAGKLVDRLEETKMLDRKKNLGDATHQAA
jgi:hypothetical protein